MIYFYLISAYIRLAFEVYVFGRLRQKRLRRRLEMALKPHGLSLAKDQVKRIDFYTGQSALTNFWFSRLRGKKTNKDERNLALLLGAITPFVDDLNDEHQLASPVIFDQLKQPLPENATSEWRAIGYLYPHLKQLMHPLFERVFWQALAAQDASMQQWSSNPLSFTALDLLTKNKGGYATLLYRAVLMHPLRTQEEAFILKLGYVLQLTNDFFDAYKDHQNGQQTLVTQTPLRPLVRLYEQLCDELLTDLHALDYSPRGIRKCWLYIVPVLSRGLVSAAQLEDCPLTAEGIIDFGACTRSNLICDMEKPGNILKSLRFSLYLLHVSPEQ